MASVLKTIFLFLFPAYVLAQQPATNPPATQNFQIQAVPQDPFELATGPAMLLDTPEKRASVMQLVRQAQQNSDLHMRGGVPFKLSATFQAVGPAGESGPGELTETWMSGQQWRWTARFADYQQIRIATDGRLYDDDPVRVVPLRLQMARQAIFWPISLAPNATLRIASAHWNNLDVMCVLSSGGLGPAAAAAAGRRWVEKEFCIDPHTGLLQEYSEAPGIYVVYNYQSARRFHGHTFPGEIVIYEGSNQVLQINLQEVQDPAAADAATLVPTPKMQAQATGPVLRLAERFPQIAGLPPKGSEPGSVIIHASISSDGKVLEAEALQDAGSALSKAALDLVQHSKYPASLPAGMGRQREAFINVRFEEQQQAPASNR